MLRLIIGLTLLMASSSALAQQRNWPTGLEREVDEGVYMQVFASQSGWRVWRTETASGVDCRAIKSAKGLPHPIPVGVGSAMYLGEPFLAIYKSYDNRVTYSWFGEHYGRVRVKIRRVGQRFWDEFNSSRVDMGPYGEESLEIVVSSWEYPEVLVGYSELSAQFELAGATWALGALEECEGTE